MSNGDRLSDAEMPARRSDVEWVELGGEAVLYDPRSQTLHRLNVGAAAVWVALDGTTTEGEITDAIEEAYLGARNAIARDVTAAIQRFRRSNLLQQ
jgi:Coenzyme PQQ synthesis protein D (PqqD)